MNRSIPPILCTGFPAWEGDYQKSTVQLMRAVSHQHPVLYVEYPFSYKDVWQGYRYGNKPYRRIMGMEPRLRQIHEGGKDNLHILTLPPILPVNGFSEGKAYELMATMNASRSAAAIRKALGQLGYDKPILINAFNPFLGAYMKGMLSVSAEYYYCYDQIGAARWTYKHGPRLEDRYLKMVDGIFTSSLPLLEDKLRDGQSGTVIKNGVNLSIFEQAFLPDPGLIGKTVLGYLGTIDDRIDCDILFHLLDSWEEAMLLMVGRITEPEVKEKLSRHPRIELAGSQQPDQLPTWVKRMDIGLIPFVKNDFTKFIYPLKINEYLAAGLPVVSTKFSDLSDFEEIIYTGETPEEFLKSSKLAAVEDSRERRKDRQEFARSHSWESRAEQLLNWLESEIHQKSVRVS